SLDVAAEDIDRYVSPAHRHHLATETELLAHSPTIGWIKETYSALKCLERDTANADILSRLDQIRTELDAGTELFGAASFPEFIGREQTNAKLQSELRTQVGNLEKNLGAARQELNRVKANEVHSRNLYKSAREQNDAMRRSTSWRITRPLRGAKRALSEPGFARRCAVAGSRIVYNRLKLYRMLGWPMVG